MAVVVVEISQAMMCKSRNKSMVYGDAHASKGFPEGTQVKPTVLSIPNRTRSL
jgi:hypothetical protein